MKKLLLASPLAAALCLAIWLTQSGCTIIGFAVGASQDNRQPKQEMTVQGMEIYTIKAQTRITVYRKNLEPLTGYFKEAVRMNPKTDTAVNGILLQQKSVDHRIPLDQIEQVYVPARKATGKIIGAVVGLAIDAGLYVLALSNLELDLFSGFGGLCPYVYPFDGTRYQLDAELCSGAFYPAAQRSDWATLRHLRPTNGTYRLKLANELQETDHIDQLRLLLFDCAPGARVYPTSDGTFLEIKAPRPPRLARTPEGADPTPALQADDSAYWTSNPMGRSTGPGLSNEQVELTFDCPSDAASAALLLRLRNTPWTANRHRAWLELQGRALPDWYAELAADAGARSELNQMLRRECNLRIQVWDGVAWKPAGEVPLVGPAVDKELAFEVKTGKTADNTLRLRLEGPAGCWMVNSAWVDFSYTRVQPDHQLLPENALLPDGTDVAGLLGAVDAAIVTMAKYGDTVDVNFPCPASLPERSRTAILQCNGFYMAAIQTDAAPQTALFKRLLREPGAYSQWRLQTLNAEWQAYVRQHQLK